MTDNLTERIRRQFDEQRHLYAGALFELLRIAQVSNDLTYDGKCTIRVERVVTVFTKSGVDISFPADGIPDRVNIVAPYSLGAVETVVKGLLLAAKPTLVPSTVDTTICCGRPIPAGALRPWRSAGDTVHEGKVYHCPRCNEDTLVDVFEVIDPEQTGDLTDDGGDR